jgi:hypothetical protein
VLRARDALVSVRTELINTARGLVKSMGMEKYGHTTLLRQVKGVGPITSPAHVLALEDPQRFSRKSLGRAPIWGWCRSRRIQGIVNPS